MTETTKASFFWSIVRMILASAFFFFALRGFLARDAPPPAGCPLAHERVPTPVPDHPSFPGVGMYHVEQPNCFNGGGCNARVSNSCAATPEARRVETTIVFNAWSGDCGGYDDDHETLVVYPNGTCLFVSTCPSPCPGR